MFIFKKTRENNEEYTKTLSKNIDSKIKGAIVGGAIGDALGVPFEFMKRDTFKATKMEGYKKHYQPIGTWSDDTAFTLCQLDNLLENGDRNSLMNKFKLCIDKGYNAPRGKLFDIGKTCYLAIDKYAKTKDLDNCSNKDEYSNGNGAMMRIAPIAIPLMQEYSCQKRYESIKKYTEITHGHLKSILGSYIYIELLIELYKGNTLSNSIRNVKKTIGSLDLSKEELIELKEYDPMFNMDFPNTNVDNIKSTGYVVDTLLASVWSVYKNENFKDSVLTAINLGDDTDTIGTVTANIAGAIWGVESIPIEWINKLYDKNKIIKLANDMIKKKNKLQFNI